MKRSRGGEEKAEELDVKRERDEVTLFLAQTEMRLSCLAERNCRVWKALACCIHARFRQDATLS